MAADVLQHPAPVRQGAWFSEGALRELLRSALADVARPVDVRVSCSTWSYFGELDLTNLIRDTVIGRNREALVLHEHRSGLPGLDHSLLNALVEMGIKVRLLPRRLPDIVILGDDLTVLTCHQNLRCPQGFLVESASLASAIRQLHSALWQEGVDWKWLHAAVARLLPDPVRGQVLIKLCSGATDETAARQLNISVRTYRRHVAAILDGLGVTSRFQAGLRAAELGLLVP